jgi:hypothetical protein
MSDRCSTGAFCIVFVFILFGCGAPGDGIYSGKIGSKQVTVEVKPDGEIALTGYWQRPLSGAYERGTFQGKDMKALVFEGPVDKKFKLRILYEEEGEDWVIYAVQSRTYGPGARYVSTEEDSVFSPPPRLSPQPGS